MHGSWGDLAKRMELLVWTHRNFWLRGAEQTTNLCTTTVWGAMHGTGTYPIEVCPTGWDDQRERTLPAEHKQRGPTPHGLTLHGRTTRADTLI